MTYTPLHVHTDASMLDGLAQVDQVVERLTEANLSACAMTDHGNLFNGIKFLSAMQKAGKKPILGIEFYVCKEHSAKQEKGNAKLSHMLLLAKNTEGWHQLLKIIYEANQPYNFYRKPRLSLPQIAGFDTDQLIFIDGHLGSCLSSTLLDDNGRVASIEDGVRHASWCNENFSDYFLECQLFDAKKLTLQRDLTYAVRAISEKTDVPVVATPDAHYAFESQAEDQQILLCRNLGGKTLDAARKSDVMSCFFQSSKYYIPSYEDMTGYGHTKEELDNTNVVADMCGDYDGILQLPICPSFSGDAEKDKELLRERCRQGWTEKVRKIGLDEKVYGERIREELGIIEGAGLSSYFLIVADLLDYIRSKKWLPGPGRGCLTGDANVMLADGKIKRLQDVRVNDRIYTIDGSLRRVEATMRYDVDNEEMVSFGCVTGDRVTMTCDHKVYVLRNGYRMWLRADELVSSDMVWFPRLDMKERCVEPPVEPPVELTRNFAHTLGMMTTAGTVAEDEAGPYLNINLKLINSKHYNNLKKKLVCVGATFKRRWDQTQWKIRDEKIIQFFENAVLSDSGRKIPQCILQADDSIVKAYLKGCCEHSRKMKSLEEHVPNVADYGYIVIGDEEFLNRVFYFCMSRGFVQQQQKMHESRNVQRDFHYLKLALHGGGPKQSSRYSTMEDGGFAKLTHLHRKVLTGKVYDLQIEENHNYLTTCGLVHNSAAGCLVSYLSDITEVDPIEFDLLFERFYSDVRRDSLPDIDVDVPIKSRAKLISYIVSKYGVSNVSQICTFTTLRARGAVKDVLRAHGISFDEMNKITDCFPDEHKITEELEQMKQDTGESSTILWTLENDKEKGKLREWCHVGEDGSLQGPLAREFEQAIRLEGTKTGQSKHAAGIIVSPEPLDKMCPVAYDKENAGVIAGLEMGDLEAIGMMKLDILGINFLDKMMDISEILAEGNLV